MGMDISGINPKLRGEEPTINWDNCTEEERDAYWEKRNKFQSENPGVYFRANIWSWRPIAMVIVYVNEMYDLKLDEDFLRKMHYNDGGGLKTQEECDKLADFMESFINTNFEGWEYIGMPTSMLYYKVVNDDGTIREQHIMGEEVEQLLDKYGVMGFIKDGEIVTEDRIYHTSHSTGIEHLREFIAFLRECGGFEIW